MDGVVESLVQRYLYEATYSSTSSIARESRRRRRRGSELGLLASGNVMGSDLNRNRRKYLKKAEQASEGVRCDIQVLVGITDVSLSLCFLCSSLWRNIFEGSAA
jgi:hypothetical protein